MLPLGLTAFGIWLAYLAGFARLRKALLNSRTKQLHKTDNLVLWQEQLAKLPGATPALILQTLSMGHTHQSNYIYEQLCNIEIARHTDTVTALGTLVAAAPLLGLLGTVFGMVGTFTAVSQGGGDTAVMVADGIRLALVTTQAGLIAALPGTFGMAHLLWLRHVLRKRLQICSALLPNPREAAA